MSDRITNFITTVIFHIIVGLFGQLGAAFILIRTVKHMED